MKEKSFPVDMQLYPTAETAVDVHTYDEVLSSGKGISLSLTTEETAVTIWLPLTLTLEVAKQLTDAYVEAMTLVKQDLEALKTQAEQTTDAEEGGEDD